MDIVLPSKYRNRRRDDYPLLEEQLDMLWHAMDKNPDKRLEPFYSTIKAIKDKHLKVEDTK